LGHKGKVRRVHGPASEYDAAGDFGVLGSLERLLVMFVAVTETAVELMAVVVADDVRCSDGDGMNLRQWWLL